MMKRRVCPQRDRAQCCGDPSGVKRPRTRAAVRAVDASRSGMCPVQSFFHACGRQRCGPTPSDARLREVDGLQRPSGMGTLPNLAVYSTESMLLVFVWDVNVPFSLYSVHTVMGPLTNAKKLTMRATPVVSWKPETFAVLPSTLLLLGGN